MHNNVQSCRSRLETAITDDGLSRRTEPTGRSQSGGSEHGNKTGSRAAGVGTAIFLRQATTMDHPGRTGACSDMTSGPVGSRLDYRVATETCYRESSSVESDFTVQGFRRTPRACNFGAKKDIPSDDDGNMTGRLGDGRPRPVTPVRGSMLSPDVRNTLA